MINSDFLLLVKLRLAYCQDLITIKKAEYSPELDRLQNFKSVAAMNDTTPSAALWGMASKQIVSVKDMLLSDQQFTSDMVAEKVGDVIVYMLLAEACMVDENRILGSPLPNPRQRKLLETLGLPGDLIATTGD